MTKYEWRWIRLRGSWWELATIRKVHASAEPEASKGKQESEQKLTELLDNGWQIVSVVPEAPNGIINVRGLEQETWTVFLQRPRQ
jgi:hypothetical protein